jgi:hypothetical protein
MTPKQIANSNSTERGSAGWILVKRPPIDVDPPLPPSVLLLAKLFDFLMILPA